MKLDNEEWRPVVGWEVLYEVSSHGRVRSLPRERVTPSGGKWVQPGRVMKPSISKKGYSRLTLHTGTEKVYVSLYRLVCEAFHGSPTPEKPWALHRDGNPRNNRAENLYWGSPSENALDRVRHGNNPKANATHCPQGHPYDEENTYLRPGGRGRDCRKCRGYAAKESKERILASGKPVPHGSLTGYTNFDCRCPECKEAYTRYWRSKKSQGSPPEYVGHGNLNAYNGYGCRCDKCREAMREYYRSRREEGRDG